MGVHEGAPANEGVGEEEFLANLSRPVPSEYRQAIKKISLFGTTQRLAQALSMLLFNDRIGLSSPRQKGELLKSILQGGELIDLGCGLPHRAEEDVAAVAKALEAKRYIGVDNWYLSPTYLANLKEVANEPSDLAYKYHYEESTDGDKAFSTVFVADDMLAHVSRIESPLRDGHRVFFMSNLEQDPTMDKQPWVVEDYFDKLWREFQRVTKPGDLVILNHVNAGPPRKPRVKYKDSFQEYGFEFLPGDKFDEKDVAKGNNISNMMFIRK